MTSSVLGDAVAGIRRWKADPVAFVREVFGVEPDAWQADVLRAFPTHQRIAMKACKGPGKSCVLAWLGWNFLATRLHPKVACTSITGDNLADGLWTEFAKWQGKSALLKHSFTWTKTRIVANAHPETWWCSARSWPRSADSQSQADTLAGLHADNMLFIIDEAGGVPDSVASAADAGLANVVDPTRQEAHLLIAGNPTSLEGTLYRACTRDRALWHITEITSDPDDPKRTPRVSKEWAKQQIDKHGRENPWVLVNVFGKFPPSSLNALIGPDEVADCMKRILHPNSQDGQSRLIGVDPARFGDDPTVIIERQGRCLFDPHVMRGAKTEEIAGRVALLNQQNPADAIFVDATGGYGSGVVDALRLSGLRVIEVNFSSAAKDDGYFNLRTEIWWDLVQWCKTGGKLPNSPDLVKELCEPTYSFQGNKIRLEEKDQIKARLGWSPNIADAAATTFAVPIVRRQRVSTPADRKPFDPLGRVGTYGTR